MKLAEVYAMVADAAPPDASAIVRELIVRLTIDAVGLQIADDDTIVALEVRPPVKVEWEPPGGYVRPPRYPRRRRK